MSKYLTLQNTNVIEEIYKRQNEADSSRAQEYKVAIKIQSWWRGTRTRKNIVELHRHACTVQSAFRRYKGKLTYQDVVKMALNKMRYGFYAEMATRIQARWRGYYTRKYKHNYYARKTYLKAVLQRNDEVIESLAEYAEAQREEKEREHRRLQERQKILQARRLHFMRSTYQTNSVFKSPWFPKQEFETLLASVKPLSTKERTKLFPNKKTDINVDQHKLPPLKTEGNKFTFKIQGPFRDRSAVRGQRFRPLSPSLRVATAFDCIEQDEKLVRDQEWTKCIQNKPMSFPVRRTLSMKSYGPLLHTTSKYGNIPYGSKYFREETVDGKASFKSVVPPIPIFSKFGNTYGKGTV